MFQSAPPVARIVVDLKEPVNFDVRSLGTKVVIEVPFLKTSSVPAAPTPPSASVEKKVEKKEQGTPGGGANTPSEPVIAGLNQVSGANAYKLQDKAKDLKVQDLQSLEDKASVGDPEAETLLALALHSGTLLRRDDAEALRLLHKAADQGAMAAQESLGIFLAMGIGMEQPAPAEALEWYKKAAGQGSLDAATNIALMYADGIGVPKDPAQAMTWFRRAAEGGDATAQYNLALIYGRGKEVPQDYKESVRWLGAAADQNVVPATLDLAAFYLHPPDGTPADVARAIHYYEKAAALGNVPAEVTLGNIFANGAQGKPDYEKAVTWYSKAADQGQPDAQFGLALRYALGQGVPLDLEEALRLFVAAANQGQAGAQFNLATMYEEGKGTPADRALAAHYYQLSAEQGMPKAQFRLGRLLADNKETRSDKVSAYKWLMLAENSIKESSAILSDVRKSMKQEEINEAEREVDNWRIAHPENPHR
jgi:TPR repeat protein